MQPYNKRLIWLFISSLIYIISINTSIGYIIFSPIQLLITYTHEFGHAFMCLISGGHVESLQISLDGSGETSTVGGSYKLIIMGGYIGSCIFSNILMLFSLNNFKAKIASFCLGISTFYASIFWYHDYATSLYLCILGIAFLIISKLKIKSFILQFISIASLIAIILDFNVGPTSDLEQFEKELPIFSYTMWMYIWLLIVLVITIWNVKTIIKSTKPSKINV